MKYNILKLFTNKHDNNIAFNKNETTTFVENNRKTLCKKYGLVYKNLKFMNQTHSNNVEIVNESKNIYNSDAIVSNINNSPLMVIVADCIPILFYDGITSTIAAAHAGRNGTFLNISSNVIKVMLNNFSCNIENIKIQMGPSIQKCCYEVSQELASIAIKNFGAHIENNRYLDLQKINYNQLINLGILKQNITMSNICTKCNGNNHFSYRNNDKYERFAGLIVINNKSS